MSLLNYKISEILYCHQFYEYVQSLFGFEAVQVLAISFTRFQENVKLNKTKNNIHISILLFDISQNTSYNFFIACM